MKVALVVGHDRENQGAYSEILSDPEYPFFLFLLSEILSFSLLDFEAKLFHHMPFTSYTAKQKDTARGTAGYDLVLEFHFNAFNEKANGCEALYNSKNEHTRLFASTFCELMSAKGFFNRGPKPIDLKDDKEENGEGFLRLSKPNAVLLEPFFGDNEKDCKTFMDLGPDGFAKVLNDCVKIYKEHL